MLRRARGKLNALKNVLRKLHFDFKKGLCILWCIPHFFCQMSGAVRENWKVKISCHLNRLKSNSFFPCTNDYGWKKQLVDIFYRWKFRAPLILIPKLFYAVSTLAMLGRFWNWIYRSRNNKLKFWSILDLGPIFWGFFCMEI